MHFTWADITNLSLFKLHYFCLFIHSAIPATIKIWQSCVRVCGKDVFVPISLIKHSTYDRNVHQFDQAEVVVSGDYSVQGLRSCRSTGANLTLNVGLIRTKANYWYYWHLTNLISNIVWNVLHEHDLYMYSSSICRRETYLVPFTGLSKYPIYQTAD